MSIGSRNIRAGLILLPIGLLAGLAMALYAFVPMVPVPAGLQSYDDLPRRLLRLAHIAAIMLPLINIAIGLCLDRVRLPMGAKQAASWLLIAGAILLPLALALEGIVPALAALHVSALPAIAFTLGTILTGIGAARGVDPNKTPPPAPLPRFPEIEEWPPLPAGRSLHPRHPRA